ncbi:MAG: hydroxyisourate hydrolase, partial [Acinetobacter sp.]
SPTQQKLVTGIYKVTFKTGEWFQQNKQSSFFPEVPVIFEVDGTVPHYHIPLLLSPYGYSTYRGN